MSTALASPAVFKEKAPEPHFGDGLPPASAHLLQARIKDLKLHLEGTRLEKYITQLYEELEARGITHRPECYLSDQWGCPSGVPVIGIPFHPADQNLLQIEDALGAGAETERDIMMYLRHEAGHAFNYAYKLYESDEWKKLFGDFGKPYLDTYKPHPFSRKYVAHLSGWYAQKHPDEDFAETFAVFLTPNSNWAERYKGWGALKKLQYMQEVVARVGRTEAPVTLDERDVDVGEMEETVLDHYRQRALEEKIDLSIGDQLDQDLQALFEPENIGNAAADTLLRSERQALIASVTQYSGVSRAVVKSVLDHLLERVSVMKLTVHRDKAREYMTRLTALLTTLAMNFLYTDKFFDAGLSERIYSGGRMAAATVPPLKISVLHYQPSTDPMDPVVQDVIDALKALGHTPTPMAVHDKVFDLLEQIDKQKPDLVFNVCETFADDYRLEVNVAAVLELARVRFTGSGTAGLLLAQDKILTKQLLEYHEVNTPNFLTFDGEAFEAFGRMNFPLIVKPARSDASIGIGQHSVVKDWDELTKRVREIRKSLNDEALAEEFIDGREVYVGVIGTPTRPEILPIVELNWGKWSPDVPKVSDRLVKFGDTGEDHPHLVIAEDISPELKARIERSALLAYRALKIRDYARVDFRISAKTGEPFVLEVNPNPYLEKDSELAMAAEHRGLNYGQLIEQIIESAAIRYGLKVKPEKTTTGETPQVEVTREQRA